MTNYQYFLYYFIQNTRSKQEPMNLQPQDIKAHVQPQNSHKIEKISIETIIKEKFNIYLKHKHLVEELFVVQDYSILESFLYLWNKGGKKVRIIIAIIIHELYQNQLKPEVIKFGGLIELLHSASLIIDDIEDGSIKRRGQDCAHLVYGLDSSISSSNLMYFLPVNKLISSIEDRQLKFRISQIFLTEMSKCHIGQGLDIKIHKATKQNELPSTQEYIRITQLKTGGLLRMLAQMLGAFMNIKKQEVQLLVRCMNYIGVAFQITDDILNIVPSQNNMGKGIAAEDFHQRKFTLIVDYLRHNQQFINLFFVRQKDQSGIKRMLQIVYDSQALSKCKLTAIEYTKRAQQCIDHLNCPNSKENMKKFINYLIERKS